MTYLLGLLIAGVVTGCIYALISTGLVVTYTCTGIFNFAHGAIAMASAFMFWQLWQGWGLPMWLSLALMLLVVAPLFGVVVERVLMRPLDRAPGDVPLVVTLGLLLALVGAANIAWNPSTIGRYLPQFFDGAGFRVAGLLVTWEQVIAVGSLAAVGVGLRLLFTEARIGIALRAVVDNPRLLGIAGGRPERVKQVAWVLSCQLAALAGIYLGAINQLNILNLTLLVIDGYAAAIIGRLRSVPMAVAGSLAIAVGQRLMYGYLPTNGFLSQIFDVVPIAVLFVAVIVLPQDRLRTASYVAPAAPRVAGLRSSLAGGAALVVVAVVLAQVLSAGNLRIGIQTFGLALALLSLVLLTGYGGMASLCQMAFVGLGAVAMGHVGHGGSLLGVLAAIGLAGAAGAVLALPTLRLRGLYLALLTFAFATLMEGVIFGQILGVGGSLTVPRVHIPGLPTTSDAGFFVFSAVVFALCAIGVLALRRGPFGRRLVAVNDSPAACATLGLAVNRTKLAAFTLAAALAGLGGVLYGGGPGQVSTNDFAALVSLVLLLLARLGGITTAGGALAGALTYSLFQVLDTHVPQLGQAQYLLTGLAAVTVGRDPLGLGGHLAAVAERLRRQPTRGAARLGRIGVPTGLEGVQ